MILCIQHYLVALLVLLENMELSACKHVECDIYT